MRPSEWLARGLALRRRCGLGCGGLDWMLTSAFVLALAWFGLVLLVAVRVSSLCLLSGVRVRAQATGEACAL